MRSSILAAGLLYLSGFAFAAPPRVDVVIAEKAPPLERRAADEIAGYLKRLYQAEINLTSDASGTSPAVFVGRHSSTNAGPKFDKGWPELSEQGHVLRSTKLGDQPVLLVGGGSPAATYWAAAEWGHRLGIRNLLYGDLDPVAPRIFSLAGYEVLQQPRYDVRAWQLAFDSPVSAASWSGEESQRLIGQLSKLKFNRLLLSVQPWQPFIHWQAEGIKKQTGVMFVGEKFVVSGDTAGRAAFRGAKYFENPDFIGESAYQDRLAAGKSLLNGLIDAAHAHGMTVGLAMEPFAFPKEFSAALPKSKPYPRAADLAVICDKPAEFDKMVMSLAQAQVRAYVETYPQLDAFYLRVNSEPALHVAKRLLTDKQLFERGKDTPLAVAIAGGPEIASLPLSNHAVVAIDATLSGMAERKELPTGASSPHTSPCWLLPLSDKHAAFLPQSSHTSLSRVLASWMPHARDGFAAHAQCIGDLELSTYLLSRNSFGANFAPPEACEELLSPICGEEVASRVMKAIDLAERATTLISDHEAGFARLGPDVILKHYESIESPPAWWGQTKEAYLNAMNEMYRANSRAREGGRSFTLYLARRYEFGFEYMNCIEAVRKAGLAKHKGDGDTQAAELQKAVESINGALNALAAVARSPSDRGTIAALNEYGYRPLVKALEAAEEN